MSDAWTKEPWKISHGCLPGDSGFSIASDNALAKNVKIVAECWPVTIVSEEHRREVFANAARIVACVNACAGIPTDRLQSALAPATATDVSVIEEVRAALEVYARFDFYIFLFDPIGQQTDPTKRAREALAKLDAMANQGAAK